LRGILLERTEADGRLRDGLFRLIDVLPQLQDSEAIAVHMRAYLVGLARPGSSDQ
jgi:hypothetical protein